MKKIALTLITSIWLMSGCANSPQQMIIAPQVYNAALSLYQGQQASLKVTDMRSGTQVVQILRKNKAAQLYSPQEDIANIIDQSLQKVWLQQGLSINAAASNQIDVFIDKAVVNVNQELLKYDTNSQITIRVAVDNGRETLTKIFNSTGSSNGPLLADLAVLERDFNQLLAQQLSEILRDHEIQKYIK